MLLLAILLRQLNVPLQLDIDSLICLQLTFLVLLCNFVKLGKLCYTCLVFLMSRAMYMQLDYQGRAEK